MFDIINPRQTVLVGCRGQIKILGKEVQKDNLIAIDWHTPVSPNPYHYSICIGKTKFSKKLIDESGVFSVNFMSFDNKDEVLFCGRHTGEHFDKFKETGLKIIESDSIDCPRVCEAVAYLECKIVKKFEFGSHVTFIGKVINSKFCKISERLFHTKGDSFGRL